MKRYKFKYIKNQQAIKKKELKNLLFLYLKNNQLINKLIRQKAALKLNSSGIRYSEIFSFCLISGRTRFINKNLVICRHIFKEYIETGKLTGFYFDSW